MNPRTPLVAEFRIDQDAVRLSAGRPVRAEHVAVPIDVAPHDHACHEIGLVIGGTATHVTSAGEAPLSPGDIFVVPPDEVHAIRATHDFEVINAYYLSEWLMSDLGLLWTEPGAVPLFLSATLMKAQIVNTVQLRLDPEAYDRIRIELRQIEAEGEMASPSPLYLRSCLQKIVAMIVRAWMQQDPTAATLVFRPEVWAAMESIERAVNAGTAYSVGGSAKSAGLSVDHFSTLFRTSTGYGPTDYFQRRRVQRACQLLLDPQPSITEVATDLGFADAPHFCRLFKRYKGMTPTEYRDIYKA